jgi:hypothetical protein
MRIRIHISYSHSHSFSSSAFFLQLKSGTFYLANNICPSNNPTIAEGPENSVPAMGCVAIKFLLFRMHCHYFTNRCFSGSYFKYNRFFTNQISTCGNTTRAPSTGTDTITKSAVCKSIILPAHQ